MLAAYRNNAAAARRRRSARTYPAASAQTRDAAPRASGAAAKFQWTEYERLLIAEAFRRGETFITSRCTSTRRRLLPAAAFELARKALEARPDESWRCARKETLEREQLR